MAMFANKNHAGSRCARCHNLLKEEDSAEYREGAWYHKMCWDEGVRQLNTAMKRAAEIARCFALPRVSTPHSEADHTNSS